MASTFGEVSREEWGARHGGNDRTETLSTPVHMVRFVLRTNRDICVSKENCIKTVQEIQKSHQFDWHLSDINYNFLIGGDNNVYEGRGWNTKISKMPNHVSRKILTYLTIGYIGDFTDSKVPAHMQDTAYAFIRHYIREGKIHQTLLEPPARIRLTSVL